MLPKWLTIYTHTSILIICIQQKTLFLGTYYSINTIPIFDTIALKGAGGTFGKNWIFVLLVMVVRRAR